VSTASAPIIRHVSRVELSQNRFVWLATGGTYALFAVVVCLLILFEPHLPYRRMQVMTAFIVVAAVVHLRAEPPRIGTWQNHLVIACVWVTTDLCLWAFQPGGSIAIGASIFIGPLAAVRLIDRRQIAAHLAAASSIAVLLSVFGGVDQSTQLATVLMVPASWVLAYSCVVILEAAETQGDELEALVRRDPLTGVGNRRLLDERLDDEIRRHERTARPLSVLSLDLNDFKILNDQHGHAAGDELLRDVAAALTRVVEQRDTVVRQGGDEFCLILPETSAAHALRTGNAVRAALAGIDAYGRPVTAGVGIASYPDDAVAGSVLLHVADERLLESKQHSSTRRTAQPPRPALTEPIVLPEHRQA
jgi:diguanylate cyclase (GGDEF)-like protein